MIGIKVDMRGFDKLERQMNDLQKKQLPFAMAKALTVTASDAKKAVDVQLPRKLDRPTPFTKRAIGIKRASKRLLQSEVFVKDIQAEYLKYAIEGGTRRPKGKAIATPGSKMKLNKYGNMPGARGKAAKLLANKKRYFSGKPKGMPDAPAGIWERGHFSKRGNFTAGGKSRQTNLRLVVAYEKEITYKKRLPFYKIVNGVAQHNFEKNFHKAFADAIRTAR